MMGLKHVGNAVFVDDDPVDVSGIVEEDLKGWNFYPYVEFPSLERVSYGFVLAKNPPKKSRLKERYIYGTVGRDMTWENSIAPLFDFNDAVSELREKRSNRSLFEEFGYVDVIDRKAYQMLLEGEYEVLGPKDWVPGKAKKALDWSGWKGPGIYDMREVPPTQAYPSEEAYELESMEYEAGETLDYMFQGDEWKDLVKRMVDENMEEILA